MQPSKKRIEFIERHKRKGLNDGENYAKALFFIIIMLLFSLVYYTFSKDRFIETKLNKEIKIIDFNFTITNIIYAKKVTNYSAKPISNLSKTDMIIAVAHSDNFDFFLVNDTFSSPINYKSGNKTDLELWLLSYDGEKIMLRYKKQ